MKFIFLIFFIYLAGFAGADIASKDLPLHRQNSASVFTSSRGELLLNGESNGAGGVFNLSTGHFLALTPGRYFKKAQIFETPNGDLIYVFVDESGLVVYNARSGDRVRALPFYQMPGIADFNRRHPELEYEARISQGGDQVRIAVVPSLQDKQWSNRKNIPWLILNLTTGNIAVRALADANVESGFAG